MSIEQHLRWYFCTEDPFRLYMDKIHNDGDYVVATNGKILVQIDRSLRDLNIGSEVTGFPEWKNVMPDVLPEKVFTMPLDDLFTPEDQVKDRDPESEPCKFCNGEGTFDHDCDCELCEEGYEDCEKCAGTGIVDGKKAFHSYTRIGSYYYRAAFINQILGLFKLFGAETCDVMEYSSGLRLSIEGVTCLCMRVHVNEREEFPHSPPYEIVRRIEIAEQA